MRDDQGEELKSVDAAKEEAVAVLGEILRYRGASFGTTRAYSVIVTDADGQTVVSVTAAVSHHPPEGRSLVESPQ